MREILFRGKRIDSDEWVEGSLLTRENDDHASGQCWIFIKGKQHLTVCEDGFAIRGWIAVDPATVGQYTGLKDKNGKMIFEGDVVLSRGSEEVVSYGIQEVDAFEGMGFNLWSFFDDDGNGYKANGVRLQSELEVIGNIHDKEAE